MMTTPTMMAEKTLGKSGFPSIAEQEAYWKEIEEEQITDKDRIENLHGLLSQKRSLIKALRKERDEARSELELLKADNAKGFQARAKLELERDYHEKETHRLSKLALAIASQRDTALEQLDNLKDPEEKAPS